MASYQLGGSGFQVKSKHEKYNRKHHCTRHSGERKTDATYSNRAAAGKSSTFNQGKGGQKGNLSSSRSLLPRSKSFFQNMFASDNKLEKYDELCLEQNNFNSSNVACEVDNQIEGQISFLNKNISNHAGDKFIITVASKFTY